MAAETNVKSPSITNLDAIPYVPNSTGQGAKAYQCQVDDTCAVNATAIASAGSYYRLCRFPTNAKVHSILFATSTPLDTNASNTLAFDLGIAFSDSTIDGTQVALQGLIPTTANNGATTTFAAYSAPNKLFGTVTAAMMGRTAAYMSGNLVFNGIGSNYSMTNIANMPIWQLFGFVEGRGYPMDPGGMFDLYAYASTGAATGVAGTIWGQVEFTT